MKMDAMEKQKYNFIDSKSGQMQGPFDLLSIRQLVASGKLTRQTPIIEEDGDEWVSLELIEKNTLAQSENVALPTSEWAPPPIPGILPKDNLSATSSDAWVSPPPVMSPAPRTGMQFDKETKMVLIVVGAVVLLCCVATAIIYWATVEKKEFTNSLGMKFVRVPGVEGMFSVWETRVGDFEAFVRATGYDATAGCFTLGKDGFKRHGEYWKNPGFMQSDTHPVCGVSWEDAQAFCKWLTEKERREKKIKITQSYRLPTDAEWSVAVGETKYPWGNQWPPPKGAGNYASEEAKDGRWPDNFGVIQSYRDGYARTSPVGSFTANRYGLYDMGGNVWEWCEDWCRKEMNSLELRRQFQFLNDDEGGTAYRVLRGSSWENFDSELVRSSCRFGNHPYIRFNFYGFRCVLVQQNEVNCSQGKKDLSEIGDNSCENVSKRTKDILQITERAERGNIEAQFELGMCYADGNGVPKDLTEAVKWFRKAANQGYAAAQNNLGVCYYWGNGVAKDSAEAVKWFRKAADQGYARAQYDLGLRYYGGDGVAKDSAEAVKWFRKAAVQGLAQAQYNLGLCYRDGNGVAKDSAEAVKWFRKAADQGYAKAQYELGFCYGDGDGVPKDLTEAMKWFREAADQGYAEAQNNLGLFYRDGYGIAKDSTEAAKWFRRAAEQGNEVAQNNLADCYWDGIGVPKNRELAIEWYKKSAEQGYAAAQFQLGIAYLRGECVSKNEAVGVEWLRKSAEQGYEKAKACFR